MPDKQPTDDDTVRLVLPRDQVAATITTQIERGVAIRDRVIDSLNTLRDIKGDQRFWASSTAEFLRTAFSITSIAVDFERSRLFVVVRGDAPLARQVANFRADVNQQLDYLRSVLGRLEWMSSVEAVTTKGDGSGSELTGDHSVFVVHGRDEASRDKLAAFLRKIGLDAVILDEVPSAGRTIIEKFEQTAETVGYAVVLLTPDDVGGLKGDDDQHDRARQNVIYELGYFAGKLGRGRVCLLQKGKVEIPSDLYGVVYLPLDDGDWQLRLAREMKAAGVTIDVAKLLGT